MKSGKLLFLLVIILVFSFNAGAEVIEKIVAKVNDQIILKTDIEEMIYFMRAQGMAEGVSETELKEKMLQSMINDKIVVIAAEEEEVELADEEINFYLDSQIDEIKSKYPTEEIFLEELQKQKMTLAELKSMYREQIKNQLLSERLIEKKVKSKIYVKSEEVEEYYEGHKEEFVRQEDQARLTTIWVPLVDFDSAKKKMGSIRSDIASGNKTFELMARKYSEGDSASAGGHLGEINFGFLNRGTREAISSLEPGELSEIVLINGKLYLFQLNSKEGETVDISQIVIEPKSTRSSKKNAYKKITRIRKDLLAGTGVGEIGEEYVNIEEGKLISTKELNEVIRQSIKDLPIGGISEVLELENGYYIFKVEEILGMEYKRLKDVYNEISDLLYNIKLQGYLEDFIEEYKENVYIKIYGF